MFWEWIIIWFLCGNVTFTTFILMIPMYSNCFSDIFLSKIDMYFTSRYTWLHSHSNLRCHFCYDRFISCGSDSCIILTVFWEWVIIWFSCGNVTFTTFILMIPRYSNCFLNIFLYKIDMHFTSRYPLHVYTHIQICVDIFGMVLNNV